MKNTRQNKEIFLGMIPFLIINGKIVITIEEKWQKFFKSDKPSFQAKIDKDGKYVIVGPVLDTEPTVNHRLAKEVTNNDEV